MRGSAKSRVREQDGSEVGGEDLARNTLMCDVKLANLHPNLIKSGIEGLNNWMLAYKMVPGLGASWPAPRSTWA